MAPIPFLQLFRYASNEDLILLGIANLFILYSSLNIPLVNIVYGLMMREMNDYVARREQFTGSNTTYTNTTSTLPITLFNDTITPSSLSLSSIAQVTTFNGTFHDAQEVFMNNSYHLCMIVILFGVTRFLALYLALLFFSIAASNQAKRVKLLFFKSLLRQEVGWFERNRTGDFAIRITSDLSKFEDGIGEKIALCLNALFAWMSSLISSFYYGWELTLVCLVLVPLTVFITTLIAEFQATYSIRESSALSRAFNVCHEVISSIRTVLAFSGEKKEAQRFKIGLDSAYKYGLKRNMFAGLNLGFTWMSGYLGFAICLLYSTKFYEPNHYGGYDEAHIITILWSAAGCVFLLNRMMPFIEIIQMARGSASNLFSVIERESQIDVTSEAGLKPLLLEANVRFENVYFTYPTSSEENSSTATASDKSTSETVKGTTRGTLPVLSKPLSKSTGQPIGSNTTSSTSSGQDDDDDDDVVDDSDNDTCASDIDHDSRDSGLNHSTGHRKTIRAMTMEVKSGQTIALVGPSGSGKSTALALLQRFYEINEGSITLDGHNLRDLNLAWLRSQFGVVTQEPVLFDMSIADNIRLGARPGQTLSDYDIEQAARSANAHSFIVRLPAGYATRAGARGLQLSGGQKQRIAIARALVRQPKILLLDEATSALDLESEAIVQKALDQARIGRTTFIVAHRLSTVRNADRILVFDRGTIVESGTHEELLRLRGLYYQINAQQRQGVERLPYPDDDDNENDDDNNDDDDDDDNDDDDDDDDDDVSAQASCDSILKQQQHHRKILLNDETQCSLLDGLSFGINQLGTGAGLNGKGKGKRGLGVTQVAPTSLSLWQVLKFIQPELGWSLVGVFSSLLMGLCIPISAMIIGDIATIFSTDDPNEIRTGLYSHGLLYTILALFAFFVSFIQVLSFGLAGEKIGINLRLRAFRAILTRDITWFDHKRNNPGSICARLASDVGNVQSITGNRTAVIFQSISILISTLIFAVYFNPKFSSICALFVGILLCSTVLQAKYAGKLAMANRGFDSQMGKIVLESSANIRTLVSLHQEEYFIGKCEQLLERDNRSRSLHNHLRLSLESLKYAMTAVSKGSSFYIAAHMLLNDEITIDVIFKLIEIILYGLTEASKSLIFISDIQKARKGTQNLYKLVHHNHLQQINNLPGRRKSSAYGVEYSPIEGSKSDMKTRRRCALRKGSFFSRFSSFFTGQMHNGNCYNRLKDTKIDSESHLKRSKLDKIATADQCKSLSSANLADSESSPTCRLHPKLGLCGSHNNQDNNNQSESARKYLEVSQCKGSIKFRGLCFNYPSRPDACILRSLDLEIKAGKSIALVGRSGCGKSTIVQLLERFYDYSQGEILLDGVDIRRLPTSWLRSQMALVSQEPSLLSYTIGDNIRYGDNSRYVEFDEVVRAAQVANIHEFIMSLPDQYETQLNESNSLQLSGGQKQRIAIARALVRKAPILIFDEATSALDTKSEQIVQEALERAQVGKTSIIIAHRLSTIKNADGIVVLKGGSMVEQGSHQELMDKRSEYYCLYKTQSKF